SPLMTLSRNLFLCASFMTSLIVNFGFSSAPMVRPSRPSDSTAAATNLYDFMRFPLVRPDERSSMPSGAEQPPRSSTAPPAATGGERPPPSSIRTRYVLLAEHGPVNIRPAHDRMNPWRRWNIV